VKKLSTLLFACVVACSLSLLSFAQTPAPPTQNDTQTKIVTNPNGSKKEIQKKDGKMRRREVKKGPNGQTERRRQSERK
jgi:hypothetical protein